MLISKARESFKKLTNAWKEKLAAINDWIQTLGHRFLYIDSWQNKKASSSNCAARKDSWKVHPAPSKNTGPKEGGHSGAPTAGGESESSASPAVPSARPSSARADAAGERLPHRHGLGADRKQGNPPRRGAFTKFWCRSTK